VFCFARGRFRFVWGGCRKASQGGLACTADQRTQTRPSPSQSVGPWVQSARPELLVGRTAAPKPRGGSISPLEEFAAEILDLIAQQPDLMGGQITCHAACHSSPTDDPEMGVVLNGRHDHTRD
jgi:hypothetical protein